MQAAERLTDVQAILRAAFALSSGDMEHLWHRYVSLGGAFDDFDLVLFLAGLSDLPLREQVILGRALDESASAVGVDLELVASLSR